MLKLKIGDTVKVTVGKDKGREGKVERIFPDVGSVLIPGVNLYKKHVKASGVQKGQKGGIYDLPRPLVFSKVALLCPKCNKVTRVGFRLLTSGEKVRICKKCKKEIDTK
jgi:large subunit ribosomal protein L24